VEVSKTGYRMSPLSKGQIIFFTVGILALILAPVILNGWTRGYFVAFGTYIAATLGMCLGIEVRKHIERVIERETEPSRKNLLEAQLAAAKSAGTVEAWAEAVKQVDSYKETVDKIVAERAVQRAQLDALVKQMEEAIDGLTRTAR